MRPAGATHDDIDTHEMPLRDGAFFARMETGDFITHARITEFCHAYAHLDTIRKDDLGEIFPLCPCDKSHADYSQRHADDTNDAKCFAKHQPGHDRCCRRREIHQARNPRCGTLSDQSE